MCEHNKGRSSESCVKVFFHTEEKKESEINTCVATSELCDLYYANYCLLVLSSVTFSFFAGREVFKKFFGRHTKETVTHPQCRLKP